MLNVGWMILKCASSVIGLGIATMAATVLDSVVNSENSALKMQRESKALGDS
jgi:hypothetical protein